MTGIAQKIIANPEAYSIDMLTQGVQDGTVPAYIGIPLIQEKNMALKQQQALMGGAQQMQQPPIAQQVLADAQQSTGLDALPTGLPAEGYAPGGIIAFADGGEADDEEDDLVDMSEDEKQLFDLLRSRLAKSDEYEEMSGIGALPAGAAKAAIQSTKREVSSKVGNEPKQTRSEGITQLTKEGMAPEALINKIMQKESGGRRYDEQGNLLTSPKGAQGEMQVMPGTSRDPGFGIRPARAGDHEDLARVGREYFSKMLDKYGDPKLAAIAYNWGPGNTDKWLMAGADPSKLPRETQKYSANMAAGGRVPGFADGVYVDPMGFYSGMEDANPVETTKKPMSYLEQMGNIGKVLVSHPDIEKGRKASEEKNKAQAKPSVPPKMDMVNPDEVAMAAEKAARYAPPAEPKVEEAAVNPMADYIGEYASYLKDRKEQLAKDKETNKYLALLQAGLGMMGGTSRYAGANIGQGASQGVAAYMAGNKQQAAEQNAIQQGMLGLTRADLYQKMHLEDLKQKALGRKDMQAYRDAQTAINEINARANQMKAQTGQQRLQQDFNLKAEKAWKESDDYGRVVKDLVAQKKNWDKDPDLLKQFNDARLRYIKNNLSDIQSSGNVLSADELLKE